MPELETKRTGLAFSGGGIRSSALCSGVLRRLLQKRAPIDSLSTVSGGGYTGIPYMDWKFHNQQKDNPVWHKEFFDRLRQHASPLCDCYYPCVGVVDAIFNIILILFWSFGLALLRAFSLLIPMTYIIDYVFGETMRNQFTCHEQNANLTVPGLTKDFLLQHCIPKIGANMVTLFYLYLGLFFLFVVPFFLGTLIQKRTPKYILMLIAQIALFALIMTFLPCFIEMYISFTPEWARYFIIITVFVVWVGIPSMRDKASLTLMALVFAYFVRWRIFKTPMFGFGYTHEIFWIMVWVAGVLLWMHPYIGMLQMYAWHRCAAFKYERALFSQRSRSTAYVELCQCCPLIGNNVNKPLTIAHLVDVQPSFQCNVTVNNWRKSNSADEQDFEVLTFSPTSIERIDHHEDDEEFGAKGFLKPDNITLSEALMTSAALLSYDLGGFEDHSHSFREIRIMFGLGFGNIKIAQPGLTKSWLSLVVTLIVQLLFGLIIIGVPIGLYLGTLTDWDFWQRFGLIAYICCFLLMSLLAILPTGDKSTGWFDKFVRWCIINILHVRIMRTLFGVTNVGSVPPPIMSLSDGGHAENLGLLPLLKQRLQRIVVVNGGALFPEDNYGTDLLRALRQARQKLHCSFTGVSGRDIEEDVRANFVEKPLGKQPRSYRFKVSYYEMIDNEERNVGEGEVLFLMPRHPDDGVAQFQNYKWRDCSDDVSLDLDEAAWGPGPGLKASDVERLSGCCFECCHWKPFNVILNPLMGRFPFQSTVNQMFSPSQFSAHHREGYCMGMEGSAAEFLAEAYPSVVDVLDNVVVVSEYQVSRL